MEICVTGASGFIGKSLANQLCLAGHSVRAVLRPGAVDAGLAPEIERLFGSWDDASFLARAVEPVQAVIHLAGAVSASSAEAFNRVNQGLSRSLVEALRASGNPDTALLHVSSLAALGPCATPPGPDGDARPAPISNYGRSKLLGEAEVLALAPERPVAVVRPSMVYGPGDHAFLPIYRLARRLGAIPAPGRSGQPFGIVCVDDLVQGLEQALEALSNGRLGSGSRYCLDGPEPADWREYARCLGLALGRRVRAVPVPLAGLRLAAMVNGLLARLGLPTSHLTRDKVREAGQTGWLCSHALAARDFGYAPRLGLAEGLARTVDWCRAQGLL